MMWWCAVMTILLVRVQCLPADTLALAAEEIHEKELSNVIFIINIKAIKNGTAKDVNELLDNEIIEKTSNESTEKDLTPTIMLVVSHDDEHRPVNLSQVADDLERDSLVVEKFATLNVTYLIRLDLTHFNATSGINESTPVSESPVEGYLDGQVLKVRRKRTLCMTCMMAGAMRRRSSCGGGCGCGGCQQRPRVQTTYKVVPVYVAVITVPVKSHPAPNYCDPCARG